MDSLNGTQVIIGSGGIETCCAIVPNITGEVEGIIGGSVLDQRTVLCGGMGRTLRLSMPEQLRNISAAGRIAVRVCDTRTQPLFRNNYSPHGRTVNCLCEDLPCLESAGSGFIIHIFVDLEAVRYLEHSS